MRVLLVGSGFVAPYHLRGWAAAPDAEVVAMVSKDPAGTSVLAREHGVETVYDDLQSALSAAKPDVVDICTPVARHAEHIRAAIRAGADVICQKPLAPSLHEAIALADAVKAAGRRLMVHESFRFRTWYRALKAALAEDVIGDLTYMRSSTRFAGTVTSAAHPDVPWSIARQPYFAQAAPFLLLDSVIHQIDVARFLLGEAERVYARIRKVSPHVRGEDMVSMIVSFQDADAVLDRSYASRGHEDPPAASEEVLIEGTKGAATIDRGGRVRIAVDEPSGRRAFELPVTIEGAYPGSYAAAIAHFAQRLRSGEPFETDIEDNLHTLDIVFAAYRSAATGEAVALPTIDRLRKQR
jgi:D-apiose dehydrogenase